MKKKGNPVSSTRISSFSSCWDYDKFDTLYFAQKRGNPL